MNIKIFAIACFFPVLLLSCSKQEMLGPTNTTSGGGDSIVIIQDEINGVPLVLAGIGKKGIIVAFNRDFNGNTREFSAIQKSLPAIMQDSSGNIYDLFGKVLEGPDEGESLKVVNSGIGFWFAFASNYPGIPIHREGGLDHIEVERDTQDQWSIPTNVVARGSGFDGIPSIDQPEFIKFSTRLIADNDDLRLDFEDKVIMVSLNNEVKVYPHKILDWHEIVNDEVGGVPVAVTYCPLTGTAKVWKRTQASEGNTYGVSGLLYNSNLLAYDRSTESLWSQIEARAVFGSKDGDKAELLPHIEASLISIVGIHGTPLVMTQNTGVDRDYSYYPYSDYKTDNRISYPVLYEDERLHPKERVFCIIVDEEAKVYRFNDF